LEELESRLSPSVNLLQYHNDNSSTGQNLAESVLTPANVNPTTFGKLFSTAVDGQVYAQPLIVTGVNITTGSNQGVHDVAIVATEHDSVYAIDANNGVELWQDSFINAATGITTVPNVDEGSGDIAPEIGITSTPVIDPATNTLYVTAKTKEVRGTDNHYVYKLHALSLADGSEEFGGPTVIGDTICNGNSVYAYVSGPSVAGTGDGSVNGIVTFNVLRQLQRTAVTIANGNLYLGFGSEGDNPPYHGWVLGYDLHTLQLSAVLDVTPNGSGGGVWASGGSLSVDGQGDLYFATGNGSFDQNTPVGAFPADGDYGDTFLKAAPDPTSTATNPNINGWGLRVTDFFTPLNEATLQIENKDLGSGGVLLLPDSLGSAAAPHLLVGAGKEGGIYLINRDNMGRFDPAADHVVQKVGGVVNASFDTPALFGNTIYYVGGHGNQNAVALSISNGLISTPPNSRSSDIFGFPGATATVSANGSANAIAWTMDKSTNQLRAYDATNLANELYTSAQADGRDQYGTGVKFAVPTVANGMVYIGTSNALVVFGLLPVAVTPPQPASNVMAQTSSVTQIALTWTDPTNNNEDGFRIEQSSDGVDFQQIATVAAHVTSFTAGGLQPGTTYTYRIAAFNFAGSAPYSNTANATTTIPGTVLDFSSGFAASAGALTFNGSAIANGSSLQLTDAGTNEAGSAFSTQAVDITHFITSFQFQLQDGTTPSGEGITFTIQGVSPGAIGSSGGGLGYGAAYSGGSLGIGNSLAVKFDLFNDEGEGVDSTGLYLNGAAPTVAGSIDLSSTPIDFHGGHVFNVSILSDGNTLQVTITDTSTGQSASQIYSVNATNVIGSGSGYVGFTGGTGQSTAVQGILSWTYAATGNLPPFAPTNLTATPVSGTQAALSWTNNSPSATGFTIERATDATFAGNVVTISAPANSTGLTDSGLASGIPYYYRVRADNAFGDSIRSNVAVVTLPTPPVPPSNARTTLVTTNEIDLAWDDNSDNEDGFHILRGTGTDGTFTLIATLPANTTTYQDQGLALGTQYEYQIQAFNLAGYDDFTGIVVSTSGTVPPPTNLIVTSGNGQLSLAWNAAQGVTSYNIYRGTTAGGEGSVPIATGVLSTAYTDTGLSSGTTYYYKVTAVLSGVESVTSNEALATTVPAAPPSPMATGGYERVNLSWGAVPGAVSYRIYRANASGAEGGTPVATGVASTSFVDSGLNDGLPYYYQITAVSSGGEGSRSVEVSAVPLAHHLMVVAPATASAGTAFTITVSARNAANAILTGYRGTIHFTSSDTKPQKALPADYTFTAQDNGVHTFTVTLVSLGRRTVTATDVLTLTTGTASVNITVGPVARFTLSAPSTKTAGGPFTVTLSAVDAAGNVVTTYAGTVHFTSSDPTAALPPDYTFLSTDRGIHAFTNGFALTRAGARTITATDTAQPSVVGTATVTVTAGTATHFGITAPTSATAGTSFSVTVVALDAYGNQATSYRGTIHFTSSDGSATLPVDYTFKSTDSGRRVFTVTFRSLGNQTLTVVDKANATINGSATTTVNSGSGHGAVRVLQFAWPGLSDRATLDALFDEFYLGRKRT
jgi:fibronectin type 3 domain-containing protein